MYVINIKDYILRVENDLDDGIKLSLTVNMIGSVSNGTGLDIWNKNTTTGKAEESNYKLDSL